MGSHNWHLFDIERGYEVRRVEGLYEIRRHDTPNETSLLTAEEFDQLRREGPSPKGLF